MAYNYLVDGDGMVSETTSYNFLVDGDGMVSETVSTATSLVKSWNGVIRASIGKWGGLAIASVKKIIGLQ